MRLDAPWKQQDCTHSLASKVDLHQRIHQVLPITVKPKNLPHAVHEGIIHCRQPNEEKHFYFIVLLLNAETLPEALTLWQVLRPVDPQGESRSS